MRFLLQAIEADERQRALAIMPKWKGNVVALKKWRHRRKA
jgi:hypothetical protein